MKKLLSSAGLVAVLAAAVRGASPDAPPMPETPNPALPFAQKDVAKYEARLTALRQAAEAATSALTQAQQRLQAATQKATASQQAMAAADQMLQASRQKNEQTAAALKAAQQAAQTAQAAFDTAAKKKAEADTKLSQIRAILQEQRRQLTDRTTELRASTDLATELKLSQVLASVSEVVLAKIREEQSGATESTAATAAEAASKAALSDAQKQAAAKQEELSAAAKTLAEAQAALTQKQQEKAAADKELAEAQAAVKPLTDASTAATAAMNAVDGPAKIARERLSLLEPGVVMPVLSDIRMVKQFTHSRPLYECRIDPAGDFVFAGAMGNDIGRWELLEGANANLTGHNSWVRLMTFDPSGKTLISAGYEGRVIWWDGLAEKPAPKLTIDAHKGHVRTIDVSPDGRLVATGGNDNLVRVWSAQDGTLVKELSGHTRHVYNVRFSPDGRELVSGDLLSILHVWNTTTWEKTGTIEVKVLSKFDAGFQADCGGIRGMEFSPDRGTLAVCGISEVSNAFAGVGVPTVVLIDRATGKEKKILKKTGFQGHCWDVAWHPSGKYVIGAGGGGGGGALWFWKPDSEQPVHDFKVPAVAFALDVHPDGLRVAVAGYDKQLRIYDMAPKTPTETALAAAAAQKKK